MNKKLWSPLCIIPAVSMHIQFLNSHVRKVLQVFSASKKLKFGVNFRLKAQYLKILVPKIHFVRQNPFQAPSLGIKITHLYLKQLSDFSSTFEHLHYKDYCKAIQMMKIYD